MSSIKEIKIFFCRVSGFVVQVKGWFNTIFAGIFFLGMDDNAECLPLRSGMDGSHGSGGKAVLVQRLHELLASLGRKNDVDASPGFQKILCCFAQGLEVQGNFMAGQGLF